jgi:hypothetical protein
MLQELDFPALFGLLTRKGWRRRILPVTLILCLAAGCGRGGSNRNLGKQAVEITRAARQAAATAERELNAVAGGVQEGLHGGGGPGAPLHLDAASQSEVAALPGNTPEEASRIVANRPFRSTRDLLRKRLISEAEYGRISSRSTVK